MTQYGLAIKTEKDLPFTFSETSKALEILCSVKKLSFICKHGSSFQLNGQ